MRGIKGIAILLVIAVWLMPLHLPLYINGSVLLVSFWIGFCYSVRISLNELTLLSLTPSLKNNQYRLHVSSLIQPFTRDTYRELELLIELLPKYNGQSLILVSPLLERHTLLRNIEQLRKLPIDIEVSCYSYWRSPSEFLVLCYYKYLKRKNRLQHSDLSRQYRLLLTLRR